MLTRNQQFAPRARCPAAHVYLTTKVAPTDDRETLADRIGFCGQKAERIEELHHQFLARR
jgi:hypothetical protein